MNSKLLKKILLTILIMISIIYVPFMVILITSTISTNLNNQVDPSCKFENGYRIDKQPIINRFPKLGDIKKCYWKEDTSEQSGIMIGPTSYWMEGFVFINQKKYDAFRKNYKWKNQRSDWEPQLDTDILGKKTFKWAFSEDFNNYMISNNYEGYFYLDLKNKIIYFDIQQ